MTVANADVPATPVCSVLIPSRRRPDRLLRACTSAFTTASDYRRIDVLVRIDDDDVESIRSLEEIRATGARVFVGPRMQGYGSLADFYNVLAGISLAPWVWIMNDDAYIVDDRQHAQPHERWDQQLGKIPLAGFIVQAEIYQLGGSGYRHCEGAAFPIVPNGCWGKLGYPDGVVGSAVDTWFDNLLRRDNGWKTHFLDGIRTVHERDSEDVLAVHRQLEQAVTT